MKKRLFPFLLLSLWISFAMAQAEEPNSKRRALLPDYLKLQYAGGIGFLSPGFGYELFPKNNGEIDLFFGYLPESIGGDEIFKIAAKFHYIPWKWVPSHSKNFAFEPITLGALAYHALNRDLNTAASNELYPENYYEWMVRTRLGPIIGSRVTHRFQEKSFLNSISLYVELGSNDLYIYSWLSNVSTVPFYKIWNSSFGLRLDF